MSADTWALILKEVEPVLDRLFVNSHGEVCRLFGVVHGSDDFYYGFWNRDLMRLELLSCVGDLESYAMKPIDEETGCPTPEDDVQ